jgi:hypothetical protein
MKASIFFICFLATIAMAYSGKKLAIIFENLKFSVRSMKNIWLKSANFRRCWQEKISCPETHFWPIFIVLSSLFHLKTKNS